MLPLDREGLLAHRILFRLASSRPAGIDEAVVKRYVKCQKKVDRGREAQVGFRVITQSAPGVSPAVSQVANPPLKSVDGLA